MPLVWLARLAPDTMRAWWPAFSPVVDLSVSWQAYRSGTTAEALQAAQRMLHGELTLSEGTSCPWRFVNHAVNVMIAAGLYREALAVPRRWSPEARAVGRQGSPRDYLLVQINLAEALYNLGRLACAANVLERATAEAEQLTDPLVRAGTLMQGAWLAVLRDCPNLETRRTSQATLCTSKARRCEYR